MIANIHINTYIYGNTKNITNNVITNGVNSLKKYQNVKYENNLNTVENNLNISIVADIFVYTGKPFEYIATIELKKRI